jgi:hypothetical protein
VRSDGKNVRVVYAFKASDFTAGEAMKHFDLVVDVGNGDAAGNHNIQLC